MLLLIRMCHYQQEIYDIFSSHWQEYGINRWCTGNWWPRTLWGSTIQDLIGGIRILDLMNTQDPGPFDDQGFETLWGPRTQNPIIRTQDPGPCLWEPWRTLFIMGKVLREPVIKGSTRRIHSLWRTSIQHLIKIVKGWLSNFLWRIGIYAVITGI